MPLETILQDMSAGEESPPKAILSDRENTTLPQIMLPSDRASPDVSSMIGRPMRHFATEKKETVQSPAAAMRRRVQKSLMIPKMDGTSSTGYSPNSRQNGLRELRDTSPLKEAQEAGIRIAGGNSSPNEVASMFQLGLGGIHDEFFEAYEELEKLGEGGASIVHKVRCKKTNQLFAAKMMRRRDEEKEATSRAEFDLMRSLGPHANIVNAESFVTSATWTYLVMEYCDGQLLQEFAKGGPSYE